MSLVQKISDDLKLALKAREISRTSFLRFVLSQIKNKEIENKGRGESSELTDQEVIDVLTKERKKRKEALFMFKSNGRDDLVRKEEEELVFFDDYLPKEISEVEIKKIVDDIFNSGAKDFSDLMKATMQAVKGKADGKVVSEIVKEIIEKNK
ncbi:MAG: GatB/YqeY domain-containing protein [Candidatus Paceibacterota bacterium]|jgi:hypothetical protein